MSNPKERHYWAQLRSALTAGQWRSSHPARAPNGALLSWSELFRKFNKHCKGFQDVAEVAAQTRSLALLVGARYVDDDEDADMDGIPDNEVDNEAMVGEKEEGWRRGTLALGDECVLPEERVEEATSGYEVLNSPESSKFDTIHLALAYYAYALRNPVACLSHLQKVPHLLQYEDHIPDNAPTSVENSLRSNTAGLLSPNMYAISTSSFVGSFASSTSLAETTVPEVRDGRGWALAETFRSLCLQGMSVELLHPTDLHRAIAAYRQALPLLSALQNELGISPQPSATSAASMANNMVFTQLREMWRWVERLIWRAVILSAKTVDVLDDITVKSRGNFTPTTPTASSTASDVTPTQTPIANDTKNSLWTWLGHYTALSAFWPPLFRAKHRSTVCAIHLRAFIIYLGDAVPQSHASSNGSSSLTTSASSTPVLSPAHQAQKAREVRNYQADREVILSQAIAVVGTYRAVLSASTRFPRAGEKNVKVEEFVELCILLWEAGWIHGARDGKQNAYPIAEDLGTSWVIDILHWAQTLTFNSSTILRHLMRLLYLSCPPSTSSTKSNRKTTRADLAKRTLKLYIQVVSKAFEASQQGIGEDVDSDVRWVETLTFGARMLAMDAARGYQEEQSGLYDGSLVADIQEAMAVLEKARSRLATEDRKLVAEVLLTEGIVWGVMGVISQDSLTRPTHLRKAHACLVQSIQMYPTSSAYYHLALSFTRRVPPPVISNGTSTTPEPSTNDDTYAHIRSLERALECAGNAVEERAFDVRYWHLLGLLLTAKEDWSGAKEVLQRGADLDYGMDDDIENGGEEVGEEMGGDGEAKLTVHVTDFASKSTTINGSSTNNYEDSSELSTPTIQGRSPPFANCGRRKSSPVTVLQISEKWLPPASTLIAYLRPSPSTISKAYHYQLTFDDYPPSPSRLFEWHLQLRMTQVALLEVMEGPEGAEEGWLEVFSWVAEHNSTLDSSGARSTTLYSSTREAGTDDGYGKVDAGQEGGAAVVNASEGVETKKDSYHGLAARSMVELPRTDAEGSLLTVPIGITISPATPEIDVGGEEKRFPATQPEQEEKIGGQEHEKKGKISRIVSKIGSVGLDDEKDRERDSGDRKRSDSHSRHSHETKTKPKRSSSLTAREKAVHSTSQSTGGSGGAIPSKSKRSLSVERAGDTSKSKKVQQMLKDQVHKSRAGISAVSRKIGGRNSMIKRANSTPDFHAVLQPTSYQASSIHSRRRLSSIIHSPDDREPHARAGTPLHGANSPTPPLPPNSASSTSHRYFSGSSYADGSNSAPNSTPPTSATTASSEKPRNPHTDRLMSNLWLMSAATFRRLGKIEQTRGAIQEAEMKDESNPNVWVQLGLYYVSLRYYQHAVDALLKARFIAPDDVSATVHLSRLYLDPKVTRKLQPFSSSSTTTSSPSTSADQPPATANPPLASSSSSPSIRSAESFKGPIQSSPEVDLAAGMLDYSTRTRGWDVPEAWYFLSRAYEMQGRGRKESQGNHMDAKKNANLVDASLLQVALELSEGRGVREVSAALGLCA